MNILAVFVFLPNMTFSIKVLQMDLLNMNLMSKTTYQENHTAQTIICQK